MATVPGTVIRLAAVPLAACACMLLAAAGQPTAETPGTLGTPDFERDVVPVLDRVCSRCHEGEDAEADVDFSLYLNESEALADPELWTEVGWQLWKHAMPPPRREVQPTEVEREAVLGWIDTRITPRFGAAPAPPPLRRLSNVEYRRAVADLTGVNFPAESFFAADPVMAGFDNQGGALSMSSSRLEKSLDAAERIAKQAIALPEPDAPPIRRLGGASLRGGRTAGAAAGLSTRGTVTGDFRVPRDGRYALTVVAFGQQAGPEVCRMAVAADGTTLERFEVPAVRAEPGRYALEVELSEGAHAIGASFLNDYYRPEAEDPTQRDRNFYVVGMELEGPLDPLPPTALQRGLTDRHSNRIRSMVDELATRAWRTPAARDEVAALLRLSAREDPIEVRQRRALEGILVSPRFLYRMDAASSDPHALAARLGFLLLGGLPDAPLRASADDGSLADLAVRRAQIARLLDEPRASTALAEDFAAQWLQLRNLDGATPDPDVSPEFDDALRASMHEETLRLFRHVLDEDLPAAELLTADYSYVDARLATHYGLPPIDEGWTRVDLAATPRRGVLGHASILTLTSTPVRTSAVARGKWLLEAVLDAPTPPPPPGTGSLDDPGVNRSLPPRAQLEEHRARAECAVCHDTLDPLGLALEGFGPTGRVRTESGGFPVDASAVLPNGRALDGPLELSEVLAEDEQALARGLLGRLATYALGRPVGAADRGWLQQALDSLPEGRPTLAGLVQAVALGVTALPPASLDTR